ncbi:MAG: DNA polymerase I [Gammaproteobacteria bacterium RIFCSPHIGHO2_12_FULL_37_14]|nr:MAG: DNA polymerase I [Gammaproteobacteria bacterium RIFCSPHIGHO2_12_FULL_37_14]
MTNINKPLILVDGSSYLYRAFHALPALMNSKGVPTGAIYGMTNMLKRLLNDYQPEYMAVIFDAKGKTFRDDLYEDYKATRKAMPNELIQQIQPIHDIIHAMGLPLLMIEGVEADDVIGTLATAAQKQGIHILISTGDKDLAQLVTDKVALINTMNNTLLNPETVKEKFGVPAERIVDYLTLVGDTSDNIPGVPSVGPKTAAKWLQEYDSLDNIIVHAEKISGKVGENLRATIAKIPFIKSLVTIKCDVDLPFNYDQLKIKSADKKLLIELYKEMEFKTWLSELLQESKENNADHYANYITILTEESLNDWIEKLKHAELFAFDTETTDLDPIYAKLVGISLAISPSKAAYIPCDHDYPGAPSQLSTEYVLTQLKPILEDAHLKKVGHNIKYDMQILMNYNIFLQGMMFDTMMESYVLDSTSNRHDMDSLALKYLGWRTITYEEVAGKGAQQKKFNLIDVTKASIYAAEDADVTLRLHELLWPRIRLEAGLKYIYEKIEMPLVPVLARMECYGVLIDPKKLETQGRELQKKLQELEQEAFLLAGQTFNINSPKQLQEILFQQLNLPILQKTPTGQASTADHVLQELALEFALPRTIIEYRSLSKLMSTYTNRLVEQINSKTKRIHTSYNQSGTATGRLSSSDPNLQNIPIRTVEGRRIRQAFIAPKGYKIISADYSQIELRIMAHISEDPGLLHAFENNLDIHQATAAEVWDTPIEKVTAEMRRNAKAINFGLIYGMSAFGLTRQLGIDRHAAQSYIDRYFMRYPRVKEYMENTRKQAKEKGYVETLWGRRLHTPDINASQILRQRAAERTAINAPLQGSAADIIKLAMLQIDQWLTEAKVNAHMIMQVHDELVFEAHEDDLRSISDGIRQHMTTVAQLRVPLIVAIGIGDNWDEASKH